MIHIGHAITVAVHLGTAVHHIHHVSAWWPFH